jgi:hypothetical protein
VVKQTIQAKGVERRSHLHEVQSMEVIVAIGISDDNILHDIINMTKPFIHEKKRSKVAFMLAMCSNVYTMSRR